MHGLQSFLPVFRRQGTPAHIVNTASIAGLLSGVAFIGPYAATKAAVVSISETLNQECAIAGLPIGVSVLCPSSVNTRVMESERSRPAARGIENRKESAEVVRLAIRDSFTGPTGLTPGQVRTLEAIRAGEFWIITHPESARRSRLASLPLLPTSLLHSVLGRGTDDPGLGEGAAGDLGGGTRQVVDRLLADRTLVFRRVPGHKHRRSRVGDVLLLAEEHHGHLFRTNCRLSLASGIDGGNRSQRRGVSDRSGPQFSDKGRRDDGSEAWVRGGGSLLRFAGPRILRDKGSSRPICFSEQYVPNTEKARRTITTGAFSPHDMDDQSVEQEIRADLLGAEQVEALQAVAGSAALVVVRRHCNARGKLIAVGTHTHPSDRFSIKVELPRQGGGPK